MGRDQLFVTSIEKNEFDKFLLGEGKYFFPGGELTGGRNRHDSSLTWWAIRMNINKYPEKANLIYELLDKTILKIIEEKKDLKPVNLLHLCMYVWGYLLDSQEKKKIPQTWQISAELKHAVKNKIMYFEKNIAPDDEELHLIHVRSQLLKERFGFEW